MDQLTRTELLDFLIDELDDARFVYDDALEAVDYEKIICALESKFKIHLIE